MAIRETIQRHPRASLVASVLVILTVLGVAYASYKRSMPGSIAGQAFSSDDGASWFVDASDPIPPFDHKGKPAVTAHLARPDAGGTLKVIYLERFTPDARTVAQKIRSKSPVSADDLHQLSAGHEYKTPGEPQWRTFENANELAGWAHDLVEKGGCGKSGFVDPN